MKASPNKVVHLSGASSGKTKEVLLQRAHRVPDDTRVERCRRAPELGPRILFFSGGSALRKVSRHLKLLTHNSIHLITPFDSGGSSARLRNAFAMPAVGDLRNRLVALADETVRGNPQVYELFSYRLAKSVSASQQELRSFVSGEHPLIQQLPAPVRTLFRNQLKRFSSRMPLGFDLRGASIGNLVITASYLENDRDLDSVLYSLMRLIGALGVVQLSVNCDFHLAAELQDGNVIVGQHLLTAKESPALSSKIKKLFVVGALDSTTPVRTQASEKTQELIATADLICFPMGSFYTSVLANLLPEGVCEAISRARCPKVFVPSAGCDPEQIGLSIADSVNVLLKHLTRDSDLPHEGALTLTIVDSDADYEGRLNLQDIAELTPILDAHLVSEEAPTRIRPEKLAELLVSLC